MAIVVETGSGLNSSANSYVSEAELQQYATDRGLTITGTEAVLLINAMDYLESLNYIGTKYRDDQPLQWPRADVVIDGFGVNSNAIPAELKRGQMAVAMAIDEGNGPLDVVERGVKRERVDVLEVEYMGNAPPDVIVKTINAALRKLLAPGGAGGTSFRVVRA